ncbi:MAG: ATP-binding protein, partial [Myxococcota bacterium]
MDLARYQTIFLEEASEHCAEMSAALLQLEKDPDSADAIDRVFRAAHSIKGMAASLGHDGLAELAHAMEDRMQVFREAGRAAGGEGLALLFRALAALERMLEACQAGEVLQNAPGLIGELKTLERSEPAVVPPHTAVIREDGESLEAPRPPATVRVHTSTLDRFLASVGEVILNTNQVRTAVGSSASSSGFSEDLDRMEQVVGELQRRAQELRTTPLSRILEPLPRTARAMAERLGKRIEVEVSGAELELDRSILDRLGDPLVHLLRNAVDHGIEAPELRARTRKPEVGRIRIDAHRERDAIRICVSDDGAGIELEKLRERAVEARVVHRDLAADLSPEHLISLIFHPGLSTSEQVSELSGRGVGMDAVRVTVESLGGSVEVTSEAHVGTQVQLEVPLAAAIQRVLLLALGEEVVALPITRVERVVELRADQIETSGSDAFALLGDELLPLLDLVGSLGLPSAAKREVMSVVVGDVRGERMGLAADGIEGQQQIYVKPVPELLAERRALA